MRKLKIAAGILLLLVVAAFVAIRWLIPTDRWVQLAYDRLESETGLVATSSSAEVSLLPLGVRLKELRVDAPDPRPDQAAVEGSVDGVLVRASLMSLLRRQPDVQEVRLIRPDLTLTLPATSTSEPAQGESSAGAVALGLLSIEEGRVIVKLASGRQIDVSAIQQSASVRLEGESVSGKLTGRVGEVRVSDPLWPAPMPVRDVLYDISVAGTTSRLSLEAKELVLLGARYSGPVTVDLSPVASVDGELQMEGKLSEFVGALLALVPPSPRLWNVNDGEIAGTVRLIGELPGPKGNAEEWLRLLRGEGTIRSAVVGLGESEDVLSGDSPWELRDARLVMDGAELKGLGCAAEGKITSPLMPPGDVEADLRVDADVGALRNHLVELWPSLPESLTSKSTSPQQWPHIAGAADGSARLKFPVGREVGAEDDPVRLDLQLQEIAVVHAALRDTLNILAGGVRAGRGQFEGEALRLRGPGMEGTLTLQVKGWPARPRLSGTARMATLDLDQLRPPEDDGQARAWWRVAEAHAAAVDDAVPPPPATWSGDLDLSALRLRTGGYDIRDVTGQISLRDQVVELRETRGELGGGPLLAQGRMHWGDDGPKWTLNTEVTNASAPGVFLPLSPAWAAALEAPISGTIQLVGDLSSDPVVVRSSLTGTGALRTGEGSLDLKPLLGDGLATVLGADAQRLARLTLKSLATVLRIETGRVHIKDLYVNGPTSLHADGWFGFDGIVDYRIDVRLPRDYQPQGLALRSLAGALRDDEGRIRFAVGVRGPAKTPSITLDTGGARDRAVDSVRDRVEDKVEDEGRRVLGGLRDQLGGILGGSRKDPPDSSAVPDTTGQRGP